MKNELLPIGSIITVGEADLMICAYFSKEYEYKGEKYDYACCVYPYGIGKDAIFVKKEAIKRVKFVGFQDGRFTDLKNKLKGE